MKDRRQRNVAELGRKVRRSTANARSSHHIGGKISSRKNVERA
jgi:hypothetical protein